VALQEEDGSPVDSDPMGDLPHRDEEPDPASTPELRWQLFRLRRHVGWARTQGLGRLIEEDQLDPFERIPAAIRRAWWRHQHDSRPNAVPVFIVGVQRSGTNMLTRGFERAPEFEVHNENDREAFVRFRLKNPTVIRGIVERSKHAFVLFKPLCDSHRITALLDTLDTPSSGRAIWAYRGYAGRVRSSVAKFGDSNRRALRRIADGTGSHLWQAGGLSAANLEMIRRFDYDRMTPESAAALFWFVRNSLYFDLALDRRPDVALASYEAMIEQPDVAMRALCSFLGLPYREQLIEGIEPRRRGPLGIEIDPDVRERCEELQGALDATMPRRVVHPDG
jgi:hypothetical protein